MTMKMENKTFPNQNYKQPLCHLCVAFHTLQEPGNSTAFGQYLSPLIVTHLCFPEAVQRSLGALFGCNVQVDKGCSTDKTGNEKYLGCVERQ